MVAVVGVLVSPEDLDSPGEGMLGWFFLWGGEWRTGGSFENFLIVEKEGAVGQMSWICVLEKISKISNQDFEVCDLREKKSKRK